MSQHKHIIIVAGGTGSRINNSVPKQFIEVNNKPVIIYTIEKFIAFDKNIHIYISVHADYIELMKKMIANFFPGRPIHLTPGGATRFESVKNGLHLIKDADGVVGVHDAARPMVSIDTIKRCFDVAEVKGNATPSIPVNDSLRKTNGDTNESVNRNDYKIIQTPQCFQLDQLQKAFQQDYNPTFTDDASVMEKAGHKINLVEGNVENIKITYPIDLTLAQQYLK